MERIAEDDIVSVDEYLRIEEESIDLRYEYVGGHLYAMVGATLRHNRIVLNIASDLNLASRGTGCRAYSENAKLQAAADIIYYPDVAVTCEPMDNHHLLVMYPCLIVEVLSPGTASVDRREKLVAYRNIPSVLTYLIVHQDQMRIERHWRDTPEAPWNIELHFDGTVPVPCPRMGLDMATMYADL